MRSLIQQAMELEMATAHQNDIWDLAPLMHGKHAGGCKKMRSLTQQAMELEMATTHQNDIWDLAPLMHGKHAVGCKWV